MEDSLSKIENLRDLALSCYGPQGSFTEVRVARGMGDTTSSLVTSSASRLLGMLSLKNQIVKLIIDTSVHVHVRCYGDGGCFAMAMACHLASEVLKLRYEASVAVTTTANKQAFTRLPICGDATANAVGHPQGDVRIG